MASRTAIAIEIGARRLRALETERGKSEIHVTRVLAQDLPADLAGGEPEQVGAWMRDRLAEAGFSRSRATVALAREHVSLKRLVLPSTDDNELPAMTRIALQREMAYDADHAVIDFVVVDRSETHATVLAVAAPDDVLGSTRASIEAAGLSIERIAVRAMGTAALVGSMAGNDGDCVLAVDVTGSSVSFCVLEHGAIRFSRAAELSVEGAANAQAGSPEAAAAAEAIITETRRTWMSYRIVEGASDVARVVVCGNPAITALAAEPIGAMLQVSATVLESHPLVDTDGAPLHGAWPLAGLLLEPGVTEQTINLADPRRPVDRSAQIRRWAMLAAGVVVIVLLAAWTMAGRDRADLDSRLEGLQSRVSDLRPRAARYQREAARLTHLDRWANQDVRWLDHLVALDAIVPPPGEAVLDGWTGSLDFRGVRFDRKAKSWSAPRSIGMVLDGEAKDRITADRLRDTLVDTAWLKTGSAGSDSQGGKRLDHGFTYRLETSELSPPAPGGAEEPADTTTARRETGGER